MRRLEKEFEGAEKAPGAAGICVTADRAQIKVSKAKKGPNKEEYTEYGL